MNGHIFSCWFYEIHEFSLNQSDDTIGLSFDDMKFVKKNDIDES